MIKLFDEVKIKKTGEVGILVDISENEVPLYTVELENNDLVECWEADIEKIDKT